MSMARHDLRGDVEFSNRPEGGSCVIVTFPEPSITVSTGQDIRQRSA